MSWNQGTVYPPGFVVLPYRSSKATSPASFRNPFTANSTSFKCEGESLFPSSVARRISMVFSEKSLLLLMRFLLLSSVGDTDVRLHIAASECDITADVMALVGSTAQGSPTYCRMDVPWGHKL